MNNRSPASWANPQNVKRVLRIALIMIPLALAGNIAYIVLTTNPRLFQDLSDFKIQFIALAVLLALLPWFGQSLGIMIWSRLFKVRITPANAFSAVLASDIGSALTPTILGGSYAKLAFLVNFGFSAPQATLVTFLGGLADAAFFAAALPIAIFWSRTWENPFIIGIWRESIAHWPVVVVIATVLIGVLIAIGQIRTRKIPSAGRENFLSRVFQGIGKFRADLTTAGRFVARSGKFAFLICVLFSGIGWCGRYGAISALVAGLGYPVDPVLFFLLQWLCFTSMTLVPTPGAIGGAEVSFAVIYHGLIPSQAIPLVTTAWRFVTFYMTVGLASIIFAVSRLQSFPRSGSEATIIVGEKTEVL